MSTKISTNNKINNSRLPFCKVCQDSGKSEKIYTSHYVKDRSGAVICPTLLAQECRYCFKKGHTIKFCKVLEDKKSGKVAAPTQKPAYTEPVKKPAAPATRFAYLEYSSDEEEEEKEDTQFPALAPAKVALTSEPKAPDAKFSYASMAAKTVTEYKVEQTIKENKPLPLPEKVLQIKISAPREKSSGKIDWANAESDSEGDEEEEDYYPKKAQHVIEDNSAW
jgi:hypothetical protein